MHLGIILFLHYMFLNFFIQEWINQTYTVTELAFHVSKLALTNLVIQSAQFFCGSTYLLDSCIWWNTFPLSYQNAYNHQTFQGGNILRGALTHKYGWHPNGVVMWGHVKNKIHISTCRRCMDTKLDSVLT